MVLNLRHGRFCLFVFALTVVKYSMAFLCPSQLTIKKKVLQGKKPLPPDVYRPSVESLLDNTTIETKSVLKSGSGASHLKKSGERTVRINESGVRRETLVEKKIRAASLAKPANVRVKLSHAYDAVDEEELSVRKGQHVKLLYRQNDWAYVVDSSGNEGFIPYCFCSMSKYASTGSKSSTSGHEDSFEENDQLRRRNRTPNGTPNGIGPRGDNKYKPNHTLANRTRERRTRKPSAMTYFPKRSYGPHLTVLYGYKAQQENDVSVLRGECVMVLNDQDPDWLWIVVEDGEEGFVPRAFLTSHACEACRQKMQQLSRTSVSPQSTPDLNSSDVTGESSSSEDGHDFRHERSSNTDVTSTGSSEKKYKLTGTRLIALSNYEGRAKDDLNIQAGEYVYANLKDQIVPNWIWAYSPTKKKSGFIPEEYIKEPIVTDI